MKFSKESIVEIAQDILLKDKISGNPIYPWIDIVGIPQRPQLLANSLFFASHSNGEGGWDNGFDRRPYAVTTALKNHWDLSLDESDEPIETGYLKVKSLDDLATLLYLSARTNCSPFVIGVTGSVGKTSTVALLEHLLHTAGIPVVRFYSKRLTPSSVKCHYINRVDSETSVIVMEYSAYLKDHVEQLSTLLPPHLSYLLNIYDTHINPWDFESKQDIFDSKLRIKPVGQTGFLNRRILEDLMVAIPPCWNIFDIDQTTLSSNVSLPPTIRTAEMYSVTVSVANQLGISSDILDKAYRSFSPKENRIYTCFFEGKKIFFHGETSGGSRLWSWFETLNGETPWFFVEEVNFADEDPMGFISLLDKVFSSEKTVVLDTPLNRSRLPVNAHFVSEIEFGKLFKEIAEGYTVYHKALAGRNTDFDPRLYLKGRW